MQNNDKHKINIKQDTVSTIKKSIKALIFIYFRLNYEDFQVSEFDFNLINDK